MVEKRKDIAGMSGGGLVCIEIAKKTCKGANALSKLFLACGGHDPVIIAS